MFNKTGILAFVVLFLVSCLPKDPPFSISAKRKNYEDSRQIDFGKEPTMKFVDVFGLKTNIQEFEDRSMKLHGKFFNNRISFYTINDPGIKIQNIDVSSITLYFIDSALMRKKYLLAEDISSSLIQTFGNFKFTPLHTNERAALKDGKIITRENGRVYMNERLANYQLKWIQDANTVRYKSSYSFIDSTFTYELVQEVNYYEPYFRMIEQMD